MSKQTERFVKGAILLSIAGILAKFVSVFYRIPLVYLVGDEGNGYYQTVFPIYSILISAGLIGIPNALSKLIAEELAIGNLQGAKKTFRTTLTLSIFVGLMISILMAFGAKPIIQFTKWDEGTKYVIWGFALSPVFVFITGALKGYFQGFQVMQPTAISQIVENISKVLIGISLVYILLKEYNSLSLSVGGAAFGTSIGYIISCILVLFLFKRKQKKLEDDIVVSSDSFREISFKTQIVRILKLAIPVSIAAAVFSIMNLIDSFTLYSELAKIGYDSKYATQVIGQMGKAYSVINFPLTISVALSTSIIPAISQSVAAKDENELNQKLGQGIKLALMLALPAAAGLFMLAKPIMIMLYPTSPEGYIYLQMYSICLIFMIIGQTLAGILQGISKQSVPIIALSIAVVCKLALNGVLIASPLKGMGAALSSIVYYGVFMSINYIMLKRNIRFRLDIVLIFVKPLLGTLGMILVVYLSFPRLVDLLSYLVSKGLGNALATLITVFLGIICYFIILMLTKTFTKEELSVIRGKKNGK